MLRHVLHQLRFRLLRQATPLPLVVVLISSTSCSAPWNGSAPGLSARSVLARSIATMASVSLIRVTGTVSEREADPGDLRSTASWKVQGSCRRQAHATTIRMVVAGRITGKHTRDVRNAYRITVPRMADGGVGPATDWRILVADTDGTWKRVSYDRQSELAQLACPLLLADWLRGDVQAPVKGGGRQRVGGRQALHVSTGAEGEGSGWSVDLDVDVQTYRWLTVQRSGWGAGCCHAYGMRLDVT